MNLLMSILCLFAVMILRVHAADPLPAPSQGFWSYRSGIVQIGIQETAKQGQITRIEKSLGTGFVVDRKCIFATAKHVIVKQDPARMLMAILNPLNITQGTFVPAKVLYTSPDRDLAFLTIDSSYRNLCEIPQLNVFPLRAAADILRLTGKDVFIIGHPNLGRGMINVPILRKGVIASTQVEIGDQRMLLLDLVGVPGFSGSPVILTESGEVIGVVYGPGPTQRQYGFEWATPLTKEDFELFLGKQDFNPVTR